MRMRRDERERHTAFLCDRDPEFWIRVCVLTHIRYQRHCGQTRCRISRGLAIVDIHIRTIYKPQASIFVGTLSIHYWCIIINAAGNVWRTNSNEKFRDMREIFSSNYTEESNRLFHNAFVSLCVFGSQNTNCFARIYYKRTATSCMSHIENDTVTAE